MYKIGKRNSVPEEVVNWNPKATVIADEDEMIVLDVIYSDLPHLRIHSLSPKQRTLCIEGKPVAYTVVSCFWGSS